MLPLTDIDAGLLGDMGALYEVVCAPDAGSGRPLPILSLQYVDFALWQRSEALVPMLSSHRAFWRSTLREGDLPTLELPLDFPRPTVQTFAGDTVPVCVGTDVVARLETFGRAHGVGCTLFQLMLMVWSVLLCRHATQMRWSSGRRIMGATLPARRRSSATS